MQRIRQKNFVRARVTFPISTFPTSENGLRIDTGVRSGDEVTAHYDPMIAKIIAHGPDRRAALDRLSNSLAQVRVAGPTVNDRFLKAIVDHPEFRGGAVDTGFLSRRLLELVRCDSEPGEGIVAFAALAAVSAHGRGFPSESTWSDSSGWRLGGQTCRKIVLRWGTRNYSFVLRKDVPIELEDGVLPAVFGEWVSPVDFRGLVGDKSLEAVVIRHGVVLTIFVDGERHVLEIDDPLRTGSSSVQESETLYARMPGVVTAVCVAAGAEVRTGDPIVVVEAMKVEHTIRAPSGGIVAAVLFNEGDQVTEGDELVRFETSQDAIQSGAPTGVGD